MGLVCRSADRCIGLGPGLLCAWGAALLLTPSAAWPQGELDDVLGGFEDESPAFEVEEDEADAPERWWDVGGSVETTGSINYRSHRSDTGTNFKGLQRLRNRLNLELDVDIPRAWGRWDEPGGWHVRLEGWGFWDAAYEINGESDYTRRLRNVYELDAEVGEAWIQGSPIESVDIKLGRQIVIWGGSETLRVLDILNPLDNREPGRVDIEDLRRPVSMLRVDAYAGDWSATAIAIPEIRFDRRPVVGSDFFPGTVELPDLEPDDFEDVELAGALTGIFSGWDVSFHGAWFWNDAPRLERGGLPTRLVHDRLWMVGSGGKWTRGSWLLKGEVAYFDGLRFFGGSGEKKARVDVLFGIEYYGLTDTTIVVEGVERHLFDHEIAIRSGPDATREDSQAISFRLTRNFLRERLQATALGVLLGWDAGDGSIFRLDVDYDLRDALVIGVGILLYQKGDLPPLDGWARNDRILFKLKWSF